MYTGFHLQFCLLCRDPNGWTQILASLNQISAFDAIIILPSIFHVLPLVPIGTGSSSHSGITNRVSEIEDQFLSINLLIILLLSWLCFSFSLLWEPTPECMHLEYPLTWCCALCAHLQYVWALMTQWVQSDHFCPHDGSKPLSFSCCKQVFLSYFRPFAG